MTRAGHDDQFGSLVGLPDGVDVPELTARMWDRRDRLDETFPFVLRMVRASDLPAWFDREIAAEKQRRTPNTKAGSPRRVTVEAILVAWLTLKIMGRSSLHSEVARFLLHTISDEQRITLGVPLVTAHPTSGTLNDRGLLDKEAVAARVKRLMDWMCVILDPSEFTQPRDLKSKPLKENLRRNVTAEELAVAQARLDYVISDIMAMPLRTIPRWLRRQYPGDISVDDTPLPLASRKPRGGGRAAWDVHGGYYRRTKPTGDRHAPKTKGGKGAQEQKVTKSLWAIDLALVVACDLTPGPGIGFPGIPVAFSAHAPSTDPAGNSKRVIDLLAKARVAARYATGDRLYPHQAVEKWHIPLADAGYTAVTDFRIDTVGRQGVTKGGAFLVDGGFVCPCTPEPLVTATYDLRRRDGKQIDNTAYQARQHELDAYRLQNKGNADENGTIRRQCPAIGTSPTVICELALGSDTPRPKPQPDGTVGDTRVIVQLMPTRFEDVAAGLAEAKAIEEGKSEAEITKIKAAARASGGGTIPTLCSKGSTSIRKDVLTKFRQDLTYGKPLHNAVYRAGRNTQEGAHGFAKDEAQESLGQPGRRRKRGLAAQSLYAAISLAVTTMRKIASFLEHAKPDKNGKMFVPRTATPGNENVALGEAGGYGGWENDEQWTPIDEDEDDDDPPDTA